MRLSTIPMVVEKYKSRMFLLFYFSTLLGSIDHGENDEQSRTSEVAGRNRQRRAILENAVQSVVKGFTSAIFCWGPPGLGKSHLLTVMLDGIAGKGWKHHTAYSTPKALLMSMAEAPNSVHLFEDCERMLKTDLAASLLRAACGSPNDRQRWVTYKTANEDFKINFTGGIIIATNQNLSKLNGPLQGVASRFRPIRWDMTLQERVAVILKIAEQPSIKGGIKLTAKQCHKVATSLIDMVNDSRSELDLDLRLFTEHALPAFAQSLGNPGMNWLDLMQAKLIGQAQTVEEGQGERTERLRELAQKIAAEGGKTKQKIDKWKSLTGLGQAIYYRHLKTSKSIS